MFAFLRCGAILQKILPRFIAILFIMDYVIKIIGNIKRFKLKLGFIKKIKIKLLIIKISDNYITEINIKVNFNYIKQIMIPYIFNELTIKYFLTASVS